MKYEIFLERLTPAMTRLFYGKTPEEHNIALPSCHRKVHKSRTHAEPPKVSVRPKAVDFLRICFSDKGVSTDSEKVKSIYNTTAPQRASEVCSFLELATYCVTFIPQFSNLTHSL